MSGVDFLDTNVLVYLFDAREPAKQAIARQIVAGALNDGTGVISHQVVQETLNVVGHRFKVPASRADRDVLLQEVLVPLWKVQPTAALYSSAIEIQHRQGFAFYDSLIVAAAQAAGCSRLLTEDLQDGQRVGRLRIENPFIRSAR